MPGTGETEAMNAAERLRTAIADLAFSPEPGIHHKLTVSVGIACSDGKPTTAEKLLHSADQALYQAKRSGRNRVERAQAA